MADEQKTVEGTEGTQETDDNDEKGIPYKNRYLEIERKLVKEKQEREQIDRELSETRERLNATLTSVQGPAQQIEDDWTLQQREIAKQEIRRETQATATMNAILNRIEASNPHAKRYRNEIEMRLLGMSSHIRSNPSSIELIANSVVGANLDNIIKEVKPVSADRQSDDNRRLVSEVLTPTPANVGRQKIELSEAEINYGEQHRLFDKGFTSDEVREMYKKRQEKKGVK